MERAGADDHPRTRFRLHEGAEARAEVRNGIAIAGASAKRLGGAEGYCITWTGVLLVEEGGTYRFWAGAPTPEGEKPDIEHVHGRRWRVKLRRGQKEWVLLSHGWPEEADCPCSVALPLKSRCV